MMEFMTFKHSNLLLLIVVPLLHRQGNHWLHSSSSICVGDSSMIVGFSLDPLGGLGYAPKAGDSSTREGNRRDPLIGVGDNSTTVGFCLVPDRACLIRATASRAGCRWPWGSGVSARTRRFSASSWSTMGLMGPAANRFFLT